MKNFFKKAVIIFSSLVFAFSPLCFAGCEFTIGDGSEGGPQSNFKTSDYLQGVKVAYGANFNPNTTDAQLITYKNEIISNALLLAKDTAVNLLSVYSAGVDENFTLTQANLVNALETLAQIDYTGEDEQIVTPLSQDVEHTVTETIPPEIEGEEATTVDVNYVYVNNVYTSYQNSNLSTNGNAWQMFSTISASQVNNSEEVYKLAYVVLYILNNFEKVDTTEEFNQAYSQLISTYDAKILNGANFKNECNAIALSVKHTFITADSFEEQALKQFVLDRVIGSNIVSYDNTNFKVYNGLEYVNATNNNTFEGDVYYYLDDITETQLIEDKYAVLADSYKGISLYLQKEGNINDKLNAIYAESGVKLYQDVNNDNIANVVLYNGTQIPLYQPNKYFRNYKNTVNNIIDNILSTKHIIFEDELQYYQNLANVIAKDYTFSQLEVASDMESTESAKSPKFSYKNLVFCATDKLNNNVGTIMMMFESDQNVQVDLSFYVRYYRQGEGYAYFNDYNSTFYPVNADSDKKPEKFNINGPFKVEYNEETGEFDEGCFIELDVYNIIEQSVFGEDKTTNNKLFKYDYKDENTSKTYDIFSIEPFPVGYCNPQTNPLIPASGPYIASVFKNSSKDNQKYKNIVGPNNENLVTYDFENVQAEQGCGYIEILIGSSNDNYFNFGLAGYIPKTELLFG